MAVKDIIILLQEARDRLDVHDPHFNDSVEVVLGILRSKGVVSYKRISVNGEWHRLLAACLVLAFEQNTDFALPTRMQGELHLRGCSTTIVSFLDKAVKEGVLSSCSPDGKAKGKLALGEIIKCYLVHPSVKA